MKAVPAARASGHTWEEIGAAIGTSRQAVWQRFRGVHEKSVPMTLPPPRFK
jgi:biotin operon repressor